MKLGARPEANIPTGASRMGSVPASVQKGDKGPCAGSRAKDCSRALSGRRSKLRLAGSGGNIGRMGRDENISTNAPCRVRLDSGLS